MTLKNWHLYRRIAVIILVISLLMGCTRSELHPGTTVPTETVTIQDYEVYTKDSLHAQQVFDDYCKRLFRESVVESTLNLHYMLSDPAAYGITEYPVTYGDFSISQMQDSIQTIKEEKAQLDSIDAGLLTSSQQLTYRILAEHYDTELRQEGLELYYQPLAPTIGIQAQLPVLLAEYNFYSKKDIDDYLTLLSLTDEYFSQILTFEEEKAAAGLFMTDDGLSKVLDSCEAYMITPERNFLSGTFTERLTQVPGLTEEEKADYTARNLQVLQEHFIPAYQLLSEGLSSLKGTGTNFQGMCYYPKGKQYYEFLVRSATTTTYASIDELRDAIQKQLNRDLTSISDIMKENPSLLEQLASQTVNEEAPEAILESLISQISQDFPAAPQCTYHIKYVPEALEHALSPAFYLVPPIDRYQDNTIYINQSKIGQDSQFPTLAHEGYPGHLYQTVYFADQNPDNLRSLLSFASYTEGWATYVENYSYTLDNGIDSDLSQLLGLNHSCMMAIYAGLDLYINYYGWSREQVTEYLGNYYQLDDSSMVDSIYNVLIANPTNYLEYYVGYLEILKMKETAEKTLKDKFSLKEFHTFLLDIGPAPFTVIEPYFNTWLMTYPISN